jgi:hypothetical protein
VALTTLDSSPDWHRKVWASWVHVRVALRREVQLMSFGAMPAANRLWGICHTVKAVTTTPMRRGHLEISVCSVIGI